MSYSIQEQLQKENEWMSKFYKESPKLTEFLKLIIKEEKRVYQIKQQTNVVLCKQRIILYIKNFLKQAALLSYNEDTNKRKKIMKVIETLPMKTIVNNLESFDKKKTEINGTDIGHEDERKICEKFVYKRIEKSVSDKYRKIYELRGLEVPYYLRK